MLRRPVESALSTRFGWTRVTTLDRTTAIRNWPIQSAGAEMLRLACNLIVEQGITLCAPVHDAVLIEADAESIDHAVAVTRDCMATASATLLDGLEIGTDAAVRHLAGQVLRQARDRDVGDSRPAFSAGWSWRLTAMRTVEN